MAENINKVYPGGSWYDDNSSQRYQHIKQVLDRYETNEYDKADVRWFIKNAIVNRIYISQKVIDKWKYHFPHAKNSRQREIWEQICKEGYADSTCMDIRKFTKGYRFEHIIPANLFIDCLIKLNHDKQLTLERFEKLQSRINICIITPEEDRLLDKNKLRQDIPTYCNDFEDNSYSEFERYNAAGIKIYRKL